MSDSDGSIPPGIRSPFGLACSLLLVGLWGHFLFSLPETYRVRLNDFPAYYGAAEMIASGHPERLYGEDFKWFTNLPVVALLLRPLALFSYADAWKLFWWLQVGSFVATYGLLLVAIRRHFAPLTPPRAALAGGIFLLFAPILHRCLALGQTTPMMVCLFALVYLSYRKPMRRLAGALLGIICVIKIPPNLLIALLVLRRRFQTALPAALVVAAAVALSFLVFGGELVSQFVDRVIANNFGRSEAAFNNQSLEGALMRVLTDRGLADWTTVPRPLPVAIGVWTGAISIALLLGWRGRGMLFSNRTPRDADPKTGSLELELALGVSLMLLLFPVVWIHYYLFLAVPLTLLPFWWQARDLPRPAWLVGLLVLGLWFASGSESHENAHYAAREGERLFRLSTTLQPLGALLLIAGLSFPLAEIAERMRDAGTDEPG